MKISSAQNFLACCPNLYLDQHVFAYFKRKPLMRLHHSPDASTFLMFMVMCLFTLYAFHKEQTLQAFC